MRRNEDRYSRTVGLFLLAAGLLTSALGALVLSPRPGHAAPDDAWWDGFSYPGVGGNVHCLLAHGDSLLLGGDFTVAGPVACARIAVWDGTDFAPLGAGFDGTVEALAVYRGEIIAAGRFSRSGDTGLNNIARWDGTSWQALGEGFTESFPRVEALAVLGDDLFVAGRFAEAGGVAAANIARWNGSAWSALGSGTDDAIEALAVLDGSVVAAGRFGIAGGVSVRHVARWNGSAWEAMGLGLESPGPLFVFKGELYAGRSNQFEGPLEVRRWNGSSWISTGTIGAVRAFTRHEDRLVAVGVLYGFAPFDRCCITGHIAEWNGTSWSQVDPGGPLSGLEGIAEAVASFRGELIVGGTFPATTDNRRFGYVTRWTGTEFAPLHAPESSLGLDYAVSSLQPHAATGRLAVGGRFLRAGPVTSQFFGLWNGAGWQAAGTGADIAAIRGDGGSPVASLAEFDGDVIVGGGFLLGPAFVEANVAAWNESGWRGLGSPVNEDFVDAMAVFQEDLYVVRGDNLSTRRLERRDGDQWSTVTTIDGFDRISALAAFGDRLVAGGSFDAVAGVPAANVAQWDGQSWEPLGAGVNGTVHTLLARGGRLYAGGAFTEAGGAPASGIALWSGGTWSPLGSGVRYPPPRTASVRSLLILGDAVIAGGDFSNAGDVEAANIARWAGDSWEALGSGTNGTVTALAEWDDDLYAGGDFTVAGGKLSFHIARWVDPVTPVILRSLTAERHGSGARLAWEVAERFDHLGFHVYRAGIGQRRNRISERLLTGGPRFEFVDPDPPRESVDYWLGEVSRSGREELLGPVRLDPLVPSATALSLSVTPMTGSKAVRVEFSLPLRSPVRIIVYDVLGRPVGTVVDQTLPAGHHARVWHRATTSGAPVPAGVYFVRLEADAGVATGTLNLAP